MPSDIINKDWLIALAVRPAQMLYVDPPTTSNNDRLLSSILCLTLGDILNSPAVESSLLDLIELERECSQQDDLCLAWSDDVSLTLCFIASLAYCRGFSQEDLSARYFQWWMNGYMSPVSHIFTPRLHIKQAMDHIGFTQAAQALGIIIDEASITNPPPPPATALLRISPIAYFYVDYSPSERLDVIKKCARAIFGLKISIEMFVIYIELLVQALKGQSKKKILRTIQIPDRQHDPMSFVLNKLIDVLRNDNDDIEQGVQQALAFNQPIKQECQGLNPYDSTETIIVTLYLQIAGALYSKLPQEWLDRVHAKETVTSLARWIEYERHATKTLP